MDNIGAIALLESVLTAFEAAKKLLTTAQVPLSPKNLLREIRETGATLDCFAYDPSCQE
ncbi:MAG: hypothetical protein V7K69_27330 [Nostoc sp.]|uniref:hypothetical protein n=1 Tax=Nostoc sp. TaxID=1180 RepID=UPI002FF51ED7